MIDRWAELKQLLSNRRLKKGAHLLEFGFAEMLRVDRSPESCENVEVSEVLAESIECFLKHDGLHLLSDLRTRILDRHEGFIRGTVGNVFADDRD